MYWWRMWETGREGALALLRRFRNNAGPEGLAGGIPRGAQCGWGSQVGTGSRRGLLMSEAE